MGMNLYEQTAKLKFLELINNSVNDEDCIKLIILYCEYDTDNRLVNENHQSREYLHL